MEKEKQNELEDQHFHFPSNAVSLCFSLCLDICDQW